MSSEMSFCYLKRNNRLKKDILIYNYNLTLFTHLYLPSTFSSACLVAILVLPLFKLFIHYFNAKD